ncbi:MAG: hypothetical protein ACT4P1_01910 [Sporichthyaceae bacterium]
MTGPTLVWHPGAHKTGTTVFQKYLGRHTELLASRSVSVIPRRKLSLAIGWGDRLMADPGTFANLVTEYAVDGTQYVVGSMENMLGRPFLAEQPGLYPNAEKNIEALAGATEGLCTRVVFTIRPQAEFLQSYYLQSIHEGASHTFRSWSGAIDLDAISWDPVIEALTRRLGHENVTLVDFRRIRDGQPAFVGDMLAAVDPSLDLPVEYAEVHNRSLSEYGLELALAVNPLMRSGTDRVTVRRFLQANFSNLTGERPVLLSDDESAAITARYGAEYDAALSRYGVSSRPSVPDLPPPAPTRPAEQGQIAEPTEARPTAPSSPTGEKGPSDDTRRMRRLGLRRR